MISDIPQGVVVAGLVGCLLALVVATAQQEWRPRVFFLLALRLAIGWQFLSEGLNKIESHYVGKTGDNKPFSSEAYFREAEGPMGEVMRSMVLEGADDKLSALVRPANNPETVGDVLGTEGLAAIEADIAKNRSAFDIAVVYAPAPAPGGAVNAAYLTQAVAKLPLNGPGAKFLASYPTTAAGTDDLTMRVVAHVPTAVAAQLDAHRDALLAKAGPAEAEAVKNYHFAAKRVYARWVLGLDAEASEKKYISGDVIQTVPARLQDFQNRNAELEQLKDRRKVDLGRSTLFAKIAGTKADRNKVRDGLIKEAKKLVADAKAEMTKLAGVKLESPEPEMTKIEVLDILTSWTLTIAGACLFFGLGTRIAAVVCGGFLVMTYLTYPPLPWLPNPPGTEGNPVFINKNAIEMLACFALACLPTGRWLGIDALIARLYYGDRTPAVVL